MRIRNSGVRPYAAAAVGVLTVALASPVHADPAPSEGSECSMSGATRFAKGQTFVCERDGTQLRWSDGIRRSDSPLEVEDAWVKVMDSGMTSAFATITNPTDEPIRIIAARSIRFTPAMELHEVRMEDGAMQMQQKSGGFVVPAGETIVLEPGGDHLMLMKIKQSITAGEEVPIRLITADGGRVKFEAMGRVFAGANESYDDLSDGMDDGGMDHGSMGMR